LEVYLGIFGLLLVGINHHPRGEECSFQAAMHAIVEHQLLDIGTLLEEELKVVIDSLCG
jgi:hypothetical protein